eukprot:1617185-Amphidinium_carterae.1
MTHPIMTDPKIRGSQAMMLGGNLKTIQITPGSAQVVPVEPVKDHPMRVVVPIIAVAVATGEERRKTGGGRAGGRGGSDPPNPSGP